MAPIVTDVNDQVYTQFVTGENNRLAAEAQMNYRDLMAMFQQDPNNQMFADPRTGQPVAPVFVPHVPYDVQNRNTLEAYNRDIVRPAHRV
jgi:hypothetical protein